MNLRDYILNEGCTQADFAELVGVQRAHLCAVITGKRTCGHKLAMAIEEISDGEITVKRLLNGDALGYEGKAKRAAPKYVKLKKPGRKRLSLL